MLISIDKFKYKIKSISSIDNRERRTMIVINKLDNKRVHLWKPLDYQAHQERNFKQWIEKKLATTYEVTRSNI